MVKFVRYFLCLLFFVTLSGFAESEDVQASTTAVEAKEAAKGLLDKKLSVAEQSVVALKESNKQAQKHLTQLQQEKKAALEVLKPRDVDNRMIDKAMLNTALARANFDSSLIVVAETQQMIDGNNVKISNLERELRDTTLAAGTTGKVGQKIRVLQGQLTYQRHLLKIQQQLMDAANQSLDISKKIFQEERDWYEQLKSLKVTREQEEHQERLHQKELELIQQQEYWQDQVRLLNQELETLGTTAEDSRERDKLKFKIFEAQENGNVIHVEVVLARLINQVSSTYELRADDPSSAGLNTQLQQVNILLDEFKRLKSLVKRKINLFEQRLELDLACQENCVISPEDYEASKELFTTLLAKYKKILDTLTAREVKVAQYQEELQKELSKSLSRRQGLPGLSIIEWASLGNKVLMMPAMALPVMKALGGQIEIAFGRIGTWLMLAIILVEILLCWCWLFLRSVLEHITQRLADKKETITHNLYYFIIELIRRHLTGIYLFAALLTLFIMSNVSLKSFMPVIYLILVWFVFKITICIARLALLESAADASGRDVRLYHNLRWTLITGGIITMLTVVAHHLPVEYQIRDFFNRLFMAFLLVVALLLLRGWRIVPTLLEPFIDNSRPYLMRVIRLMSFLIPLTILSTGVIGILGYVDMAWAISTYEGLFLLVLAIYVLVRGLLIEFMEWLSELFIRRLRNGWLWTQAILRPLDKVLRIVLILCAIAVLFMLYGWDDESYVIQKMVAMLHYNLMPVQDTEITLLGIVEFIVAAAVLFWLARWTREFAYRWIFAKTRDLGLRNSLAAFTQYTTVVVGFLIALQIIGIDLTAVKWILTALAFGIGFGLRDLARNYVSGVLMLLERPVRAGDLISIGNFEGEVTHIGMRAMTVKTWDHMEVLVPNAETFEKSFTNWTLQDSIVRTVIRLKVKREDSIHMVRDLVYEVLEDINDIVTDPSPQVFLMEIGEALLEFEIRYFINLQLGKSRVKVRSFVLFKLYEALKAHGVHVPNPQQEILIKPAPEPKSDQTGESS